MTDNVLIIIAIVAAIPVIGFIYWNSKGPKSKRRLRTTPITKIAALRPNESARIVGVARVMDEVLKTPLTRRECVYYKVEVSAQRSSGKTTQWVHLFTEERSVPFTIDDGSGKAELDVHDAYMMIETDVTQRSGTFDEPDPAERELLARNGERGQSWLGFNKALRYRESSITVNERLSVYGKASMPGPGGGAPVGRGDRPSAPARVVMLAADGQDEVLVCDDRSTHRHVARR